MLDRRRLVIESHADHVEARVPIVPPARGDEVTRNARDLRLLPSVDRLERRPRNDAGPAPHLDEDEHRPVERHEIDLPGAAAIVTSHDRVPVRAEELLGHRLTAPSEDTPPIHGGGIYSAGVGVARRSVCGATSTPASRVLRV